MEFEDRDLIHALNAAHPETLDNLSFGLIGFDSQMRVTVYNRSESDASGLSASLVLGRHFFTEVAPCMNNYMVALRFEQEDSLDEIIKYILSFKVAPTPVELRLMKDPQVAIRFIAVRRT